MIKVELKGHDTRGVIKARATVHIKGAKNSLLGLCDFRSKRPIVILKLIIIRILNKVSSAIFLKIERHIKTIVQQSYSTFKKHAYERFWTSESSISGFDKGNTRNSLKNNIFITF